MHVLVVGYPRCRTSFLCSAYSDFYNLKNYHENFDFYFTKFIERSKYTKKIPNISELQTKQTQHLENVRNRFFQEEKSIIKLFPRHLISYFGEEREFSDLNSFSYTPITNISSILQLSKYSEIIISDRNFIDSAISYLYAKSIGKFLFVYKNELDLYKTQYKKITIKENLFPMVNWLILEYFTFLDLKNFIHRNYKCNLLDYDACVSFIDTKFGNLPKNIYYDTEFDYKSIITNYDQIVFYIEETYTKYLNIYSHCKFI